VGDRRTKALVIEDDVDSRRLFGDILADANIETVCVDGQQLPEPDGFNVVISDLQGSGRSRYSSTRAREWVGLLSKRYAAPVIIVSARSEVRTDDALRRHAAHVMLKPIDVEEFVTRIRDAAARDGA
jgi:DNA-binding response OmpR family regulator